MNKTSAPPNKPFSEDLRVWAGSKKPKTIASLTEVFSEKSFAVVFVVLMSLSALPIPTGGITNVFEVVVILLALEMVVGRRSIWLPVKWSQKPLSHAIVHKGIPQLANKIAWVEKYSRPRLHWITQNRLATPLIGLVVLCFTVAAFVAPPFSGLDTLPSMGVVLISLGLILEDILGVILGIIAGAIGIFLVIGLGGAIFNAVF